MLFPSPPSLLSILHLSPSLFLQPATLINCAATQYLPAVTSRKVVRMATLITSLTCITADHRPTLRFVSHDVAAYPFLLTSIVIHYFAH
ncbi:hypothetical protein K438DRAFT_1895517, partial [Mycena galopus ATCC 62051]